MPGVNVPRVDGKKVIARLGAWGNSVKLIQDPGFGSIACRLVAKGREPDRMMYVRIEFLEKVRQLLRPRERGVSVIVGETGRMEICFELHPLRAHQDGFISGEDLLAWEGWEGGCYERNV